MSEKVSKALLRILNEMSNVETTLAKVQASIFVKKSEKMIKEKISYLYNLLHAEASQYGQNPEKQFDSVDYIMNKYREKINIVYDELYLQYANIQNEIGDARLNQKAVMINYQKIINDSESNKQKYEDLKLKIKSKNELYEKIIEKCEKQFDICIASFEDQINNAFYIESSIRVENENNIFSLIKNKILNFIIGKKRYEEALEIYEAKVDNIDTEKIIQNLREQTVEFVTDILEIKDINLEKAV